jgi:hypothetical protein
MGRARRASYIGARQFNAAQFIMNARRSETTTGRFEHGCSLNFFKLYPPYGPHVAVELFSFFSENVNDVHGIFDAFSEFLSVFNVVQDRDVVYVQPHYDAA